MSAPQQQTATDVVAFFNEHGRLPYLGDPVPPWDYRGWALPYLIEFNRAGGVPDRWGYHLATLDGGKLPDAPIPQLRFDSSHADGQRKATLASIMKWVDVLDRSEGGWSSLQRLLDWLAWGLGVTHEQPRLSEKVNEELYRAVDLKPLIAYPSDYFGAIISEGKGSGKFWNPNAFYPTPHNVVEMMCRMTFHDAAGDHEDIRKASVCDPCVGTGRMLLHASNFSMNLWGMDIDAMVCLVTKINGALYAPWITWPIPSEILGVPTVAPPPPAELPVPAHYVSAVEADHSNGRKRKRVDDHHQPSLFDYEETEN